MSESALRRLTYFRPFTPWTAVKCSWSTVVSCLWLCLNIWATYKFRFEDSRHNRSFVYRKLIGRLVTALSLVHAGPRWGVWHNLSHLRIEWFSTLDIQLLSIIPHSYSLVTIAYSVHRTFDNNTWPSVVTWPLYCLISRRGRVAQRQTDTLSGCLC